MPLISIILFYLASFSIWLIPQLGTCTQGDADQFLLFVFVLLILVLALGFQRAYEGKRWTTLLILPLTPVIFAQGYFAAKFAFLVSWRAHSACDVVNPWGQHSTPSEQFPLYPLSGEETFISVLMVSCSVLMIFGILVAVLRFAKREKS